MPYVVEAEDDKAAAILDRIIRDEVDPIFNEVIGYKSHVHAYGDPALVNDVEEIHSDAQLCLIERLRKQRTREQARPIESLHNYAAVIAYNAFNDYIRRKRPEWARLKNRLQYVLGHSSKFAVWKTARHIHHCGLRSMDKQQIERHARTRAQMLLDDAATFSAEPRASHDATKLESLLLKLFTWVDGPIELNQLVTIVASLTGMTTLEIQARIQDDEDEKRPSEAIADPEPFADDMLVKREFLKLTWLEICALPVRQRIAILLHLDEIHALPVLGIASIERIAKALDWPREKLGELWSRLPIKDDEIAAHLGISDGQRVINLRSVARIRLKRRLRTKGTCHAT